MKIEKKLEKLVLVGIVTLFLAQSPLVKANVDLMLNVTEPMYPLQYMLTMSHESDQAGATWIWNSQIIEVNATPGKVYSHLFDFSNKLGMNNITYMGTNSGNFTTSLLNGNTGFSLTISPSGNLKNTSFLVYMAPRFIVPDDVSALNITTLSILTAPGEQFNFTTIINPVLASDPSQLIFEGSRSELLNLTVPFDVVSSNGTGNYTVSARANSSYNGTFLLGVHPKTLALRSSHQAIEGTHQIVSQSDLSDLMMSLSVSKNIISAEVRVLPRYDIDGSGRVDVKDSTILKLHMAENTSALPPDERPRYDIDKSGLVNNADVTILKAHYGEIIPTV